MGSIYVLRLYEKLARKDGGARYYLGYSADEYPINRLNAHRKGQGARFTQVARERGILWDIVLIIPGDRELERQIKNRGSIRRFLTTFMKRQGYVPKWLTDDLDGSIHGRY